MNLDHNSYSDNYHFSHKLDDGMSTKSWALGDDALSEMRRLYDLIKHTLLPKNRKNLNILNVGCGPVEITGDFVNEFASYCNKIVLCEVNPIYCKSYKESDWYKLHKSKIIILNQTIESVQFEQLDQQDKFEFDLIWCSHVIGHFRLSYISTFLSYLCNLLSNQGYFIIGITEDNTSLVKSVLKDKYQLSRYLEKCIDNFDTDNNNTNNNNGIDCFMLRFQSEIPMTKKEAYNMIELFLTMCIFKHKDYNPSLKITDDDKKFIKQQSNYLVEKRLFPIKEKNFNHDHEPLFLYKQTTNYYFIKKSKIVSKM